MALVLLIAAALVVAPPRPWPTPTMRSASAPEPAEIEEQVAITSSPTAATPTPVYGHHTVVAGDTLLALAIRYGTTVEAIMAANNLEDAHRLRIGQVLLIPPKGGEGPVASETATTPPVAATPTATARPVYRQYTVVAGDTILAIAIRHGTTVEAIVAANDLEDAHRLQIGQILLIP